MAATSHTVHCAQQVDGHATNLDLHILDVNIIFCAWHSSCDCLKKQLYLDVKFIDSIQKQMTKRSSSCASNENSDRRIMVKIIWLCRLKSTETIISTFKVMSHNTMNFWLFNDLHDNCYESKQNVAFALFLESFPSLKIVVFWWYYCRWIQIDHANVFCQ